MSSRVIALVVLAIVAASCSSAVQESADPAAERATSTADPVPEDEVPEDEVLGFGPAPEVPEGDFTPEIAAAIDTVFGRGTLAETRTNEQNQALVELGQSGDVRVAWILLDLLRFPEDRTDAQRLVDGVNTLTDGRTSLNTAWNEVSNKMIAWDIPAPPGYGDIKRQIYSTQLPEWGALFDQSEGMDWRFVSWGGVSIDDRPLDQTDESCNCIPAADNPPTQTAAETTWLEDDDIVFGVVINGEARAYPRQIMEVREMVNDTLGGRDFAMPYCTLCGSAQVWFTDDVPDGVERPVLRTSGLLTRSNKVMYDLNTFSIFDTFRGTADTGPLSELGVQLNQHTVVTSTWADWKAEHPDTDALIEDLALGRDPDFRNGRDARGPIFPIGDVDPRIPVQDDVLGVISPDGTPVAFHVATAVGELGRGETIEVEGIRILKSGSGIRAEDTDGNDLVAHQAFWFAWSQFYEDTEVWPEL
ncbi:MAG: hypothetical protein ACI8Y4_004933 [Candidatus Poriferisodalaceae bacterium]|jgi:hypothetical protein